MFGSLNSKAPSLKEDVMYLGEKRVEIKKLTPKKWRELFGTIDTLPGLIVQVLLAPKDDFYSYVISAVELGMDEVVSVVSVLSGVDRDYLDNEVGLDEMIEFLTRTTKKNRLDNVIKNVKSLLPKTNEK